MKSAQFVCLIAFTYATLALPQIAQQIPPLSEGIHVQLAASSNAAAFPAADDSDAWIIAVTADSQIYFGVKPVTAEQLQEEMRITPHRRVARLYVKADARAPFAAVKQVLYAAHEDMFETVVLLTQQSTNGPRQSIVPPYGLEISLALPSARATVVQLRSSGSPSPVLKVNDQELAWSRLSSALAQASAGEGTKIVVIEPDGNVSAAPIVSAVDLGRSIGAKVAISLTGM